MTESRKQFEKWCESIGLNKIAWHPYSDDIGETAWRAWQASRAALVVSLPDWSEYDTPRQAIEACKDSLIHAGVEHSYD